MKGKKKGLLSKENSVKKFTGVGDAHPKGIFRGEFLKKEDV